MPILFDAEPGRISQFFPAGNVTPVMLTFPGFDYQSLQIIAAGLSMSLKPIYQASDTLGDDVYLVSFGESLTPLPISGLVFGSACGTDRDGLAELTAWWERKNLLRTQEKVQITIGSSYAVTAFVADMNITVASAADNIWRFELLLLRIPARTLRSSQFLGPEGGNVLIRPEEGDDEEQPIEQPQVLIRIPQNNPLAPEPIVPRVQPPRVLNPGPGFISPFPVPTPVPTPTPISLPTPAPRQFFQAPDDPDEAVGYWQRIRRYFPLFDVNTGTVNNGIEATARSTFATAPVRADGAYETIGTVPIVASGYATPQPLVGQLSNR